MFPQVQLAGKESSLETFATSYLLFRQQTNLLLLILVLTRCLHYCTTFILEMNDKNTRNKNNLGTENFKIEN